MIGIYKITSPTNKVYIGQSINIERRIIEYSNNNCKEQLLIFRSLKKYGWNKHIFEVLCECDISELNNKERYYQDLFSCIGKSGLNLRLTQSSDRSGKMSEETKLKMSANNAKFWLGKKRYANTNQKISNTLMGNKMPQEIRDKMSKSNPKFWLGKKLPEEHKKKLSLAKKGKLSNVAKIIIDVNNGVFYTSLREASIIYGIKETTLCMQLKGVNKNKTSLRYA